MVLAETFDYRQTARAILRFLQGYFVACVIAGLWVHLRTGGAMLTFDPVTYEPVTPSLADHASSVALLIIIAMAGCFLPVVLGRWLSAFGGGTSRLWYAIIWALADVIVAAGPNPLTWFTDPAWLELVTIFAVPGAIIGVIAHAIEFRGRI
ncbi:MAG: hypothetical protein AAGF88_08155 [Pseudomonadota bacterium]